VRGSVVFDDVIAGWPGFPEADRPRDQARNRPDRASGFSGRCHLEIPQRDIFPQKPGRFHLLLTPFLVALNLRFIAVPPPAVSGKKLLPVHRTQSSRGLECFAPSYPLDLRSAAVLGLAVEARRLRPDGRMRRYGDAARAGNQNHFAENPARRR
jgi:hypothetical protein